MRTKILVVIFIFEIILNMNFFFAQSIRKNKIQWKERTIEVVEDEICIKIKSDAEITEFDKRIKNLDYEILNYPDNMGIARVRISKHKKILEEIENLSKLDFIEGAEPIVIVHTSVTPNDTYYGNQWNLLKISAPAAWDFTTGTSNIIIGILDSGIPLTNSILSHPDLLNTNRIILGADLIGDGSGVKDINGHGTHVAGIASAESNNSTGVTGLSWNSKLFIVQVFDSTGIGTSYGFYQGVRNAVDNGAQVINFSGGAMSSGYYFEQAIVYARNHNCLIVAAAGNYDPVINPNKIVEWPAAYSTTYDNVIAVSSTTASDIIASSSSRGPEVNVSAPGDYIYSTLPNYQNKSGIQNYGSLSGTSMATPLVSALAGLILSVNSTLSPFQVRRIIELSSKDLGTAGRDNNYGFGRIDPKKAVENLYVPGVFSTIQSAINAAVSGQTIAVVSGTYTENINITNKSNCYIKGIGTFPIINGTITLNNAAYANIQGIKVKNKITVTNSDNVYLNIRSDHPNCYVEAVNSDIYFYDPYFFQTQAKAFYGHDNGHSDFFKGSFRNKTSQGAYLHYWATAEFTESIFCSNVFDINATGMTYAAINNYGYFSSSQYRSTVTSAVSVTPYQWYYCGSSALAKSTGEPTEADDVNEVGSAHTEFETAMNEYRIIKSYIREDLKTESVLNPSKYRSDYEKTIDAFKEVVEKYPLSTEAILSLDKISSAYRALGEYENLMNYNNSIANNKNYNVLRPHALNIEKQTLIKQGAYTKALELSDRIIKEYPNHELVVELIYSKGLIYNYYLNDKDKAAEMFKEVIAKYPKEITAQSAKEELENLGIEFENNEQILTEETNSFNVESYPNPFNPSTTISYSLPSDANVKVIIYDIMGRVVKTLASVTQPSGNHHVVWDGTNLSGARVSSGIYLYRFEAASLSDNKHFTKTAKLMLVK